eukprot:CAMPEP_0170508642 /NCGR_PEP_ID=MMETSP0208-20121228/62990_1 /TAXON_ID=197538 /ORGANISM="Strombidium inclinatum, Strain S3" /LENGTH=78 /DNA_ID=CAMNT_0010791661 /DNA_START=130 /DNA_END=366 /DNA_ORIENTATION=-
MPSNHSRTLSKPPELPALKNPPSLSKQKQQNAPLKMNMSFIPSSQLIAPRIPLKQPRESAIQYEKRSGSLGQPEDGRN